MSRQEFSVAMGFGVGPSLGSDNGLLMSRKSFLKGGTFLSRQKTLCRDINSKGGVTTGRFFVETHRAGLRTRQGAGHARQAWAARATDFSRLSFTTENSLPRHRIPEYGISHVATWGLCHDSAQPRLVAIERLEHTTERT